MRSSSVVALAIFAAATARADQILPTTEGTTWEFALSAQAAVPAEPTDVTIRVAGTEDRGRRSLTKLETRVGNALSSVDLIDVDDAGIHRYEHTNGEGKPATFDPPQTVVPAPLKVGDTWELDDQVDGTQMHQKWTVAAEDVVQVPAGTYQALRFHCEQPWPISIAIDRWFAPGFGFVKDITTTRGPTGRLLSRTTMVLKKLSQTAPPQPPSAPKKEPEPNPAPASQATPATSSEPSATESAAADQKPHARLEVSSEREGESRTDFSSDTPHLFVQWAGQGLPLNATVRVAWIAEDVGDIADPNFLIDETSTKVTRSDFAARFTLSRPQDGWAAGKYRIELYLDDDLLQTLPITIHDEPTASP